MLTTGPIHIAVLSGTLTSKFFEMVGPRALLNARGQLILTIFSGTIFSGTIFSGMIFTRAGRPGHFQQKNR